MINASNRTTENILINQMMKQNKRPTFNEAFNKINKHTMTKTPNDPLNVIHSNEQLYKFYVKETMPLLDVSNDNFNNKTNKNMFRNAGDNTNNDSGDNTNNTIKKMMRIMGMIDDENDMNKNDFETKRGSINNLPLQLQEGNVSLPSSAVDIPVQGRQELTLTSDDIDDITDLYGAGAVVVLNNIFKLLIDEEKTNDVAYNDFIEAIKEDQYIDILQSGKLNYEGNLNSYLNSTFELDENKPDDAKDLITGDVLNAIYGDGTYENLSDFHLKFPDITGTLSVQEIMDIYEEDIFPESPESVGEATPPIQLSKKEKKKGRREANRKNKKSLDDEEEDDEPVKNIDIVGGRRKRGAPIKTDLEPEQLDKNTNRRTDKDIKNQIDLYVDALDLMTINDQKKQSDKNKEFVKIAYIARQRAGDDKASFNKIFKEEIKKYEDMLAFNTFG